MSKRLNISKFRGKLVPIRDKKKNPVDLQEIELNADLLTIGRESSNVHILQRGFGFPRYHAEVKKVNEDWFITQKTDVNIYVNFESIGKQVSTILCNGDVVGFSKDLYWYEMVIIEENNTTERLNVDIAHPPEMEVVDDNSEKECMVDQAVKQFLKVLKVKLSKNGYEVAKRKIVEKYNKWALESTHSFQSLKTMETRITNLTDEITKNENRKWQWTLLLLGLFDGKEVENKDLTSTNEAPQCDRTSAASSELLHEPSSSSSRAESKGMKRKETTVESRDVNELNQTRESQIEAPTPKPVTPLLILKGRDSARYLPAKKIKVEQIQSLGVENSQGECDTIALEISEKEMEVFNPGIFAQLWIRKEDVIEDIADEEDVFVKPTAGFMLDKILKAMMKKTKYSGNLESFLRTGAFVEEIRNWHSDWPLRVTSANGNAVHMRKSKDGDFLEYGATTYKNRTDSLRWSESKCRVKMCCGSARRNIGLCPKHSAKAGNVINGGIVLLRDTSNTEEDVFFVAYGPRINDVGEIWTENNFHLSTGFVAYVKYKQERTSKGLDSTWKKILFQACKSPTELNHIRDNLTLAVARFSMLSNLVSNHPKKRTLLKATFDILSYKPEKYVEILRRLNVTFEKSRDLEPFPVTEKSFAKINMEPLIHFPRVYNSFRRPGELYIGSKTSVKEPGKKIHLRSRNNRSRLGLLMKNTRDGVVPHSHAIAQLDLTGKEVLLMSEASKKEQTLWSEEMQDVFKRSCDFAEDLETWIIFSVLELQAIGEKIDEYPIRCLNSQITKVNLTSFRIEDMKTVNTITRYWTGSALKYTVKPLDIENFPDLSDIFL